MALHATLMVNNQPVGIIYIQRLNRDVVPGEPSLYDVQIRYPVGVEHSARVEHLYEDGALVLIRKALEAVDG